MSFITRLFGAIGGATEPSPPRDILDPRFWGASGRQSLTGIAVNAQSAEQLDVIQAVLGALSDTVSILPLVLFEEQGVSGGAASAVRRVPASEHPLYTILGRHPNARQTRQEYLAEQTRHLAMRRNCYAEIVMDGGVISALMPIHPDRVLRIDARNDGRVYYNIRGLGVAPSYWLRDDEISHIRLAPLTEDGLMGRPMWETGRETIAHALAVARYGALYFKQGGLAGGVLEHPGGFKTKEDEEAFRENFKEQTSGGNAHKWFLLKYGIKATRWPVQNDQAQFLETARHMESKVARLWRMPPHRVGILDRATHSNIEQQSIEYVAHTLSPYLVAIEQAVARDLLIGAERGRYFAEFNVAGLLRGDIINRFKAFALGRQWGWLSVNDIRRMENQEPLEGGRGDIYLEPMNMKQAGTNDAGEGDESIEQNTEPSNAD